MIGIIDTCSLVAIARYYLPLEDCGELLNFLELKFKEKELILLKSVHKEACNVQKGISIEQMPFLNDTSIQFNDIDLFAPIPKTFSHQLDNNFCIRVNKNKLKEEEYIQQKEAFMRSADAKIIFYALHNVQSNPVIITEETPYTNDGKVFKKIPAICNELKFPCYPISKWLVENGISLNWRLPE